MSGHPATNCSKLVGDGRGGYPLCTVCWGQPGWASSVHSPRGAAGEGVVGPQSMVEAAGEGVEPVRQDVQPVM